MKSFMLNCAVLSGALFVGLPAFSQTDNRTTTVMDRSRPELDPQGVRVDGFVITPSIDIVESYNDNIFAAKSATKDDLILQVRPEVRAESNWSNHKLQFKGGANIQRYATNSGEDVENFDVGVSGRFDIQRDANISAGLELQKLTEDRGSADDANGNAPTEYTLGTASLAAMNRWNRLTVDAGGEVKNYNFDDVHTSGGATINNDDRDRNEFRFNVRGSYEIQPEYHGFAQVIFSSAEYNSAVDDNGLKRDSDGYEVRIGTRLDITGLVFGDVFVGYINRDYEDASLKSVDALTAGANMTWNVTPLTTLTGDVKREITETTLVSASGTLTASVSGRIDHELLRNLLLSGRLELSRDEFDGTTREDDYVKGMLQVRYLLNRNAYLTLRYEYTERDSSNSNSDFDRNIVLLQIRAQI